MMRRLSVTQLAKARMVSLCSSNTSLHQVHSTDTLVTVISKDATSSHRLFTKDRLTHRTGMQKAWPSTTTTVYSRKKKLPKLLRPSSLQTLPVKIHQVESPLRQSMA